MPLRRTPPLALAFLALACQPSVPYDAASNPKQVNYAVFDPAGTPPGIPLPNDLAFLGIASQSPAQQALLKTWAVEGFPSDQEVPIAIDIFGSSLDASGNGTKVAPAIDVTSIKVNSADANVIVLSVDGTGKVTSVPLDTPKATDYLVSGDHGTLSIHPAPVSNASGAKVRRWPAATSIIYAMRSGSVKVAATGDTVEPQAAMYLITRCCTTGTLNDPQNQTLLPGATAADRAATGAQLETLRQKYVQGKAFAVLDQSPIHHDQVAVMGTFKVAAARGPHVETDPGSGLMPLPSDFLTANGRLSPDLAAPTGPFGALGPGLATLDGFSTTAMVLSQTSEPIDATTVKTGAFIYEVDTTVNPPFKRIYEINEAGPAKPPGYVADPPPITQAATGGTCAATPAAPCVSTAIGLQPAVPILAANVALPPLKEKTTYVVLITDNVKTPAGKPLVRTTLSNLLFLNPSISIASNGKSTVAGISDAQAVGLDQMRQAIRGAAAVLAFEQPALTLDHVVLGYTFHTQSMKATAVKLAELPYGTPSTGTGSTVNPLAPPRTYCATGCNGLIADVFAKYGVETGASAAPTTGIGTIIEASIVTFNALDPATGAFIDLTNPANKPAAEPITALISLPACTLTPPCTVPLVVFRHGFGSSRGAMLTVASTLNTNGIAVAAIDMVKHGDRSFCSASSECASGGTCTPIAAFSAQGDTTPPGKCSTDFVRAPLLCPSGACAAAPSGTPKASANYLVSANFFRTRDSFRQDIIDESQLIRVLSPNPAGGPNAITSATPTSTLIDATKIWYVGQSLGSINGTVSVAANARIAQAVLNVGGGTAVDVFSQSPAFASTTNALLGSLGIKPGTPEYLKFINVAKWILDPAEPINFATNLNANTLPSALSAGSPPPARPVLSQIANCDLVVPNPFGFNLHGNLGTGATVAQELMERATGSYASLPGNQLSCPIQELSAGSGSVPHDILTDWGFNNNTTNTGLHTFTQTIQTDIANFFAGVNPPATQIAGP